MAASNTYSRLNILFVIKALGNPGGGAERVLVDIASGLAARGHRVTVMTSDPADVVSYYRLGDTVRQLFLGLGNVGGRSTFMDVVRRVRMMRKEIIEFAPDVAVAFMHSSYLPVGAALIGTGIPMVASEHIGPAHYQTRPLQRALLLVTPFLARSITVVSEQIRESFSLWLRRIMVVAPNPVTVSKNAMQVTNGSGARRLSGQKILLSVGRLASQKNQSCLIAAFSLLAKDFPDWRLRIVGEGELRPALEKQIRSLGIVQQVDLPGAISDIGIEYRNADLFVLPSTYESFGLATAEALLHRLPVIGFGDCPGTNVLVQDRVNGVLVGGSTERVNALANAIRSLMSDPEELKRLSNSSIQKLEQTFGLEAVLDKWEKILFKVVD